MYFRWSRTAASNVTGRRSQHPKTEGSRKPTQEDSGTVSPQMCTQVPRENTDSRNRGVHTIVKNAFMQRIRAQNLITLSESDVYNGPSNATSADCAFSDGSSLLARIAQQNGRSFPRTGFCRDCRPTLSMKLTTTPRIPTPGVPDLAKTGALVTSATVCHHKRTQSDRNVSHRSPLPRWMLVSPLLFFISTPAPD